MLRIICAAILCTLCPPARAAEPLMFGGDAWTLKNGEASIEDFGGRSDALRLDNGAIFLDETAFQDGVIEFEVNHPADRAFIGVVFRATDFDNYEEFYIRPHLSETPDSFQYTPVYNDNYGWQLYAGDGFTGPLKQRPGEWRKVRLVVKGPQAAVFIDDMTTPALFMNDLKRDPQSGRVGLRVLSYGSVAHFANFTAHPDTGLTLPEAPPVKPASCGACIMDWRVSPAFPGSAIETPPETLDWVKVQADPSGLLNIGKYTKRSAGAADTVLVKAEIFSQDNRRQKLSFGYSDEVVVFLNGAPLYRGLNTYGSRDYRYLGTIGFFDQVYLPLVKGRNELIFAVLENYGGWGLKARLEDGDE